MSGGSGGGLERREQEDNRTQGFPGKRLYFVDLCTARSPTLHHKHLIYLFCLALIEIVMTYSLSTVIKKPVWLKNIIAVLLQPSKHFKF